MGTFAAALFPFDEGNGYYQQQARKRDARETKGNNQEGRRNQNENGTELTPIPRCYQIFFLVIRNSRNRRLLNADGWTGDERLMAFPAFQRLALIPLFDGVLGLAMGTGDADRLFSACRIIADNELVLAVGTFDLAPDVLIENVQLDPAVRAFRRHGVPCRS